MSTPQKAQSPGGAGQSAVENTSTDILAATFAERKALSTLIAKFALRGHAVHQTAAGGFIVCWRGFSRHCKDLDALEAFAAQVGVTSP